jgi:uncharacterized RDD family membrane protein YckC
MAQSAENQATASTQRAAKLNARFSAYLIDSAVLLAFMLVFFVIAGLILLMNSNNGRNDAPDSAYYAFIAVLLGGTMIAWTACNIALDRWRGQSAGKYLVGIRAVSDTDHPRSLRRSIVRWFALSPLCFHPLLLPLWGLFALFAVFLTLSHIVLFVMLGVLLLWVVSPVVALATLLLDPSRRALHDRLAGTIVVHNRGRAR